MKVINPVLRKVLVDLHGLDKPLEFWWDDEMLKTFESLLLNDRKSIIRAPNTPSSIVEFEIQAFRNFQVTNTTDVILKGRCLHLTNISNFFCDLNLPFPTHRFNDEFEFPITLICLLKNSNKTASLIDYSNYINLDLLKANGLTLKETLIDSIPVNSNSPNRPKILFAEYTSLAYT